MSYPGILEPWSDETLTGASAVAATNAWPAAASEMTAHTYNGYYKIEQIEITVTSITGAAASIDFGLFYDAAMTENIIPLQTAKAWVAQPGSSNRYVANINAFRLPDDAKQLFFAAKLNSDTATLAVRLGGLHK